ncbi:hypothetical protein V2A60_008791 [Cordyceps javanica]
MHLAKFYLALSTATVIHGAATRVDDKTGFSWDPENLKVAAVRYPPAKFAYPIGHNRTWVNLDLNATIDRAVDFINAAGAEGVKMMGFPELYFPGTFSFPVALNYNFTPPDFAQYASQAMVHDGPEWKRLAAAFAANKMYAVVSFAEHAPADDALYMGQYLIGPDGATIHKHRKLRPSGAERNLFSDGDISSIRAVKLPFGTVTFLSCWENLWPTMRFTAASQPAHLHIASFPFCADSVPGRTEWWEHCEGFRAVVQTYTQEAGVAAIFAAVGKASIYDVRGGFVPESGNSTDETNEESFERIPYITAVLDTTSWVEPAFDVDAQHSYSALVQILSGLAPGVPRQWGTYFNHYVSRIADLGKYYVFTHAAGSALANASSFPSLYQEYGQTSELVDQKQYS